EDHPNPPGLTPRTPTVHQEGSRVAARAGTDGGRKILMMWTVLFNVSVDGTGEPSIAIHNLASGVSDRSALLPIPLAGRLPAGKSGSTKGRRQHASRGVTHRPGGSSWMGARGHDGRRAAGRNPLRSVDERAA